MNSEEVATQINLCLGRLLVDIKHLEEDKDGWKKLATKYYNALEDIKEICENDFKYDDGDFESRVFQKDIEKVITKALEVEE